MTVVILGCGYTGERVARRMVLRGVRVLCTSRHPEHLAGIPGAEPIRFEIPSQKSLAFIPPGSHVVYSIPPVEGVDPGSLWQELADRQPQRLVYLSTTGVYGEQRDVDEFTAPAPRHDRDKERLAEESAATEGAWSSVVLRPAAIYGPGRGIHESMAVGKFRLVGEGNNFVSRVHAEDLAAHVEAALLSDLTGAWPVADEHPCTSREIARYCSDLLGVPMPESIPVSAAHHTRRADRRVDGSGIRRRLGITLTYPTYRQGIPASLS